MDALIGAVIGALVAGAFTWLVALRSARFGRDTALTVWRQDQAARESALRRALLAEVEENLRRIGKPRGRPTAIERSAWDAARGLELSDAEFDALQRAYALGAELNGRIATRDAHDGQARRHQDGLVDSVKRAADAARHAFTEARDALR